MTKKRNLLPYLLFYKWICEYSQSHTGKFPTLRDAIKAGYWKSTSQVVYALDVLVEFGFLKKYAEENAATYYEIVGAKFQLPQTYYDLPEVFRRNGVSNAD